MPAQGLVLWRALPASKRNSHVESALRPVCHRRRQRGSARGAHGRAKRRARGAGGSGRLGRHLCQRRLHSEKALQLRRPFRGRFSRRPGLWLAHGRSALRLGRVESQPRRRDHTAQRRLRPLAGKRGRASRCRLGHAAGCEHRPGAHGHGRGTLHCAPYSALSRRAAQRALVSWQRACHHLGQHVRPRSVSAPPAGGRGRLYRLRVRVHLQRPGRGRHPALPRRAGAARLRR